MQTTALIDGLVTTLTGLLNLLGASKVVSDTIAKRISEGGRAWSLEERNAVEAELNSAEAYAAAQLNKLAAATPPAVKP